MNKDLKSAYNKLITAYESLTKKERDAIEDLFEDNDDVEGKGDLFVDALEALASLQDGVNS